MTELRYERNFFRRVQLKLFIAFIMEFEGCLLHSETFRSIQPILDAFGGVDSTEQQYRQKIES